MSTLPNGASAPSVAHMSFSGLFGGREKVAFLLADTLSRSIPAEVILVLETRSAPEAVENLLNVMQGYSFPRRIFTTSSRFSWRLARDLAKHVDEAGIDVIHCHCYKSAVYAALVRLILHRRLRILLTLHGIIPKFSATSAVNYLVNICSIFFLDTIVGCSKPILRAFRFFPLASRKAVFIPNACSLSSAGRRDKAACRKTLSAMLGGAVPVDGDAIWLVNIGRLSAEKNFPLFLRAARALKDKGSLPAPVAFLVVGEGAQRGLLEEMAKSLGVDDIVFFTGFIEDMDMVYDAADILVQTSLYENTPMCVLEAMSHGLPVVAPAVGGNVDILTPGEDGYLYEVNDLDALCGHLARLVSDSMLRKRAGARARATIETRYNPDLWADRHLRLYNGLLG